MNKALEIAVSIVYPRRCAICDEIVVPMGHLICDECRNRPAFVSGASCMKCGKPLRDSEQEYCADCMRTVHVFDRGYALFQYRSISGSLYRFKYMGRKEYADYYADEIVRKFGSMLRSLHPDALVPVPMYAAKERKRGYNQAEVLARAIGRRMEVPVETKVISRIRNTVPMKQLSETERRNNLKKAFNIARNDVKLLTIIVVDDIYTTGSTADEISREFRRAGVKHIYFLSLAIGQTS
ncbi:MAG: ComF family protein [Butyrivibrio sp.]|nr:ComF family protein [Butyrivibrio sp.]